MVVVTQLHTVPMRPELTTLLEMPDPVVVVSGDSGTGKSSLLLAHQEKLSCGTVAAPPPVTCSFDSGALQVAILDGLVDALTRAMANRTVLRNIQHRLKNSSTEMAAEVGKSLAQAVTQEVLAMVKARIGEHAGEGIATFFKTLRQDTTEDLRRDLKSRSDTNVVKLLVRICDEVAAAMGRDLVLALDECQRLTDDDQRALASVALKPPKRTRFVLAWSSAVHDGRGGLVRLREAGCGEVVVGGLSSTDVAEMLSRARVSSSHTERVHFLSAGYPLIVEGLIGQLQNGGSLDGYTPPTALVRSLEDALARLPQKAQLMARRLSVFELPPTESTLIAYLGLTATQWGVQRQALERENILSIERNGQVWFHESRRTHLWNTMLSDQERSEIGQPAYTALLMQYRDDITASAGLMVPIAQTARFARESQAANPQLERILTLAPAELAVLAAVIELELTRPGDDGVRWTPPETALIYAHTVFAADRKAALDALPDLLDSGLLETVERPESTNADPDVTVTVSAERTDECNIVLNGRIQDILAKSVIPQLTSRIVHEHFEGFRLESTLVVSNPGRSDAIELIRNTQEYPAHRFNLLTGTAYPMLALWIDYGEHPISLVGIFNRNDERQKAKKAVVAVDEMSYGRRVKTVRTFEDQKATIPSFRLFRAVYFATGRPVETDRSGNWRMINDGPPLSVREYAQRQITLLDILRNRVDETEKELYALREPRGAAVAQVGEDTFHFVELRGNTRVVEMTSEQSALLTSENVPFRFARLEHLLALRPGERTHTVTVRVQPDGLIDDPVVTVLKELWEIAREYNKHQPRHRIKMKPKVLSRLLCEAHIRDTTLARTLSEQLTIGGRRGHRPQHALRVAIHPGKGRGTPPFVAYTQPIGDPTDVQVRFLPRTHPPVSPKDLYTSVFGDDPVDEIFADTAHAAIAGLLGYATDEIDLVP
jgi:DNA polymerase III delta prime subunit